MSNEHSDGESRADDEDEDGDGDGEERGRFDKVVDVVLELADLV